MTKQQLQERYGTPEEYEEEVWRAHDKGYLTPEEAKEAVFNYWKDWEAAD